MFILMAELPPLPPLGPLLKAQKERLASANKTGTSGSGEVKRDELVRSGSTAKRTQAQPIQIFQRANLQNINPLNCKTAFNISEHELIKTPFRYNRTTKENDQVQEDEIWRAERLRLKGQTVTINKYRGLKIVENALKGKEKLPFDQQAGSLVKALWENNDYIEYKNQKFNRKILRMEEVLGVLELVNKNIKAEDKEAFKQAFFKANGEYIKNNFKKEDRQGVLDSFAQVFQSTKWSEGGHTQELKDFFSELTAKTIENSLKDENGKIEGLEKPGDLKVVANYADDEDGTKVGKMAVALYMDDDGKIQHMLVEHEASESEDNKTTNNITEPQYDQESLEKVRTNLEQIPELKDHVEKLHDIHIPTMLGTENINDLESLFSNLKSLSEMSELPPPEKALIEGLMKEVKAYLNVLSNKEAEQKAEESDPTNI